MAKKTHLGRTRLLLHCSSEVLVTCLESEKKDNTRTENASESESEGRGERAEEVRGRRRKRYRVSSGLTSKG